MTCPQGFLVSRQDITGIANLLKINVRYMIDDYDS